jgi:class 3 adenylate cyclase
MDELSAEELADRSGVTVEQVGRLVELGIIGPTPAGQYRRSDIERIRVVDAMAEAGFAPEQLAELTATGMAPDRRRRAAAAMVASLERTVVLLYRRHFEHHVLEVTVLRAEAALERAGLGERRPVRAPAIAFLDLAGYTRLTEERGDLAAAELATRLVEIVHELAHRHGGRPVKLLGDGVVVHFPDPAQAVRCGLELLLPGAPAALPGELDQDRQGVHRPHHRWAAGVGPGPGDRAARAGHGAGHGGRGHRDRRAGGPPARDRLRLRPGLLVRQAVRSRALGRLLGQPGEVRAAGLVQPLLG